jgi:hypothetical protein
MLWTCVAAHQGAIDQGKQLINLQKIVRKISSFRKNFSLIVRTKPSQILNCGALHKCFNPKQGRGLSTYVCKKTELKSRWTVPLNSSTVTLNNILTSTNPSRKKRKVF